MSVRLAMVALLALAALSSCSRSRKAERPAPPPSASGAPPSATSGGSEGGGVPPRDGHPRVPASPQSLLSDDAVERIQRALEERNLLDSQHERGHLDEPTSVAIRRFQNQEALAETGFPDRQTLQRLGVDPEAVYGKPEEKPR